MCIKIILKKFLPDLMGDPKIFEMFDRNFSDIMGRCLKLNQSLPGFSEKNEALRNSYIAFDKIDVRSFNDLNEVSY